MKLTFTFCLVACVVAACTVLADNAPEAVDDEATTVAGNSVKIDVLANDQAPGGHVLEIISTTQPANGTVTINYGQVTLDPEIVQVMVFAAHQLSNSVVQAGAPTNYPRATGAGDTWLFKSFKDWTSGYFPGCLWRAWEWSGDPSYQSWAMQWTEGIDPPLLRLNEHNVGHQMMSSHVEAYRLTRDPIHLQKALEGATNLAALFNPAVGAVHSWGSETDVFRVIVDGMTPVELLYWGARHGGDSAWVQMAVTHARTTLRDFVRPDGSTYHHILYNPTTGAIVTRANRNGYSDESTWARGQAWALYGFAVALRETGDPDFRESAQRVADYFVNHLPADFVPYWDFDVPVTEDTLKDSSTAAIGAVGLLELAEVLTGSVRAGRYRLTSGNILRSLMSGNYLAQGTASSGIVLHGTGEPPHFPNAETNVSLIYGDYHLMYALQKYQALLLRDTLSFAPAAGFTGTNTFTYTVADNNGSEDSAVVTVVVEPGLMPSPFHLTVGARTNGVPLEILLHGEPDRLYRILESSNLWGQWIPILTGSSPSGVISVTDSNMAERAARFYRGITP